MSGLEAEIWLVLYFIADVDTNLSTGAILMKFYSRDLPEKKNRIYNYSWRSLIPLL